MAAVPEQPAAPTLVTISSEPDGAEVYRADGLVGNTPYKLPTPTGSEQIALELRRSGYEPRPFTITALTGDVLSVTLQRKKSGSRPPPAQPAANNKPDKPGVRHAERSARPLGLSALCSQP